jgi:hypothetical protein
LGKLFEKIAITCVLAQNILDFRHRNLGFEPGTSDLFDRFFGTFLVKKTVEPKPWQKMKKFKRRIVAYEISVLFMLI